ncbi:MAG: RNA methyltransferase [Leptospira sp.]|nr:RNA methyltransferase [Leptospira sp.]
MTGSKHSNPSSKKSDSTTISPKSWVLKNLLQDLPSLEFHASCGEGLVGLLETEVLKSNLKIQSKNRGGIFFSTKSPSSLRHFLESTQISSKVGLVLCNWNVNDYDDLYNEATQFPWEDIINQRLSFRLESKTKDNLPDSRFAMYRLKDAILDRFRDLEIPFPDINKDNADLGLYLRSYMDHAVVELYLSKDSLTKKGYRTKAGSATLRENLASAMIEFSDWKNDTPLIDPFCGQGTILIQAALKWKHSKAINKKILEESYVFQQLFLNSEDKEKMESNTSKPPLLIGLDESEESLELARNDAKKAGVEDLIHWELGEFQRLEDITKQYKLPKDIAFAIITDPPFGNRLGSKEDAKNLYSDFGKYLKDMQAEINFTIITGDTSLLGFLKLKKEKEMSLKNSGLSSKIVNYLVHPRKPNGSQTTTH